MKAFLEYLEEHHGADFREERILKLKKLIASHERQIKAKQLDEDNHLRAGHEYIELTKKWEESGAYWKPLGSTITKWYLGKECFFTWFSGIDSIEHLEAAKIADLEFEKLSLKHSTCKGESWIIPEHFLKDDEEQQFLREYTCDWIGVVDE